jgi:sugar lactone lactonase YvrE
MKITRCLRCCFVLALVCALLAGSAGASTYVVCANANNIQVLSSTGTNGTPIPGGSLGYPVAIAIDQDGNLYVSNDQAPYLIEKFSPTGTDLGAFTTAATLNRPYGLAFDSAGNLYVANFGNDTVEKFSSSGADIGSFISAGNLNGLSGVVGIAFDSSGNFYAVNSLGNSVAEYTSAGVLTNTFNPSTLNYPYRIAFDTAGNFYVTNHNNNNVEKFSAAGADLGAFATANLNGPVGLTFDNNGNLDVCSESAANIEEFSPSGTDQGAVGSVAGSNPAPSDIAFYPGGQIQFSAAAYSAFEDQGTLTITATRTGGANGATSLTYTTEDGTAVAGKDYTQAGGVLSWADGDAAPKTFAVPIIDRGLATGSVNFSVTFAILSGVATLGMPSSAIVTITDNDAPPPNQPSVTLTFLGSTSIPIGTVLQIFADVSGPSSQVSQVQFTLDGTVIGTLPNTGGLYPQSVTFAHHGTHTVEAIVTSVQGGTSTGAATFTIYAEPTIAYNTAPPSITLGLTSPFEAEFSVLDPDEQVLGVGYEIFQDGVDTKLGFDAGLTPNRNYAFTSPFDGGQNLGQLLGLGTYQFVPYIIANDGSKILGTATTIIVEDSSSDSASAGAEATFLAGVDDVKVPADGSLSVVVMTTSVIDSTGAAAPAVTRVDFYADGVLFASLDGNGKPIALSARAPGRGPITRDAPAAVEAPATERPTLFEATYHVPGNSAPVTLTAVATTSDGLSHLTAPLHVTPVVETGTPPTVTLGPLTGGKPIPADASFEVPVTVSAPSIPVAMVQYYLNGAPISAAVAPPYRVTVKPPTAGPYALTAVVTDTNGVATFAKPLAFKAVPTVKVAVKGDGKAVVGGTAGTVVFTRTGEKLSEPLTVYIKLTGQAVDGVNYSHVDKKLVIPAGKAIYKLKIKALNTMTGPLSRKLTIRLLPAPDGSYATGAAVRARLTVEQTE